MPPGQSEHATVRRADGHHLCSACLLRTPGASASPGAPADSGVDQLRNSRQGRMAPGESEQATIVWGGRASPVRPAHAASPERLLRNPGALDSHCAPGIPELINSGIRARGAWRPGRANTLRWGGRTGIACVLHACSGSPCASGSPGAPGDSGVDQLQNLRQRRMTPEERAQATMVRAGAAAPVPCAPAEGLPAHRLPPVLPGFRS